MKTVNPMVKPMSLMVTLSGLVMYTAIVPPEDNTKSLPDGAAKLLLAVPKGSVLPRFGW